LSGKVIRGSSWRDMRLKRREHGRATWKSNMEDVKPYALKRTSNWI